uniref:non-specific serine/threonine protein kinase n=1 Tax=Ananas comosus var. bracteatus TaxID=296719 RepID=A0A6V7P3X4_ANACO|nr:unnamed protein product [Ananas comosus var. bracteatus]
MGFIFGHCMLLFLVWIPQSLSLNSDGQALLALSRSLMLPSTINSTWNYSDPNPCNWVGVHCSKSQRVVSLNLSSVGVSGSLGPEIGQLKHLQFVDVSLNNVSGSIPPELGNCTLLEHIDLSSNSLSGEIPAELGNCTLLEHVDLSSNSLSGEIPATLRNLRRLSYLSLYSNSLGGNIPESLFRSASLETVYLNENKFTGSIPSSVGDMSSVRYLWLSDNLLSGVLLDSIGNCSKLEELYLFDNQLAGPLPSSLSGVKGLRFVDVSRNFLVGKIPFGSDDCSLEELTLSFNRFEGEIPVGLGNCGNMTRFAAVNNSLSGQIPPSLGKLTELSILYLSMNSLSGPIPAEIGNCRSMTQLELIPTLETILIDGNNLSGVLPSEMTELRNLKNISLFDNRFTGTIPQATNLDLSLNNLTGTVASLADLNSLLALNISYNHFTGPVPENFLKFLNSSPSSFVGNPGLCISCSSCIVSSVLEQCSSSSSTKGSDKIKIVLIVVGSVLFCALVLLMLSCSARKCKRTKTDEGPSLHEGSSFLFNKVMEATENLNDKYAVGRGAHGTVYKASLSPAKVYAIKKLDFASQKGANLSMEREIRTLGRIRHRNLVKLTNFWLRSDYGLILYEYMDNGSLHDVLHEIEPAPVLEWKVRYKIALGIAQGLAYLHDDCRPAIIHCDIKPRNILLDNDMEPHISDFGIAKLIDQFSASQCSAIMGTIGYMSPETAFTPRRSKESDVYSYGVVLLELITRKMALDPSFPENTDIVNWVSSAVNNDYEIEAVCDPNLMSELMSSVEMEEVRKVLLLAVRCTAKEAGERPSMRNVVKELIDIKSNSDDLQKQRKS